MNKAAIGFFGAFLLVTYVTAGVAAGADDDSIMPTARLRPAGHSLVRRGSDTFIGTDREPVVSIPGSPVDLNLVDVPVAEAAKTVLADTLGWSYTLDDRVSGTLTLQTGGPVARDRLLDLFQAALTGRGFAMRRRGTSVQILPAGTSLQVRPVRSIPDLEGDPGPHAEVVALHWISAVEMRSILIAVAPRDVVLRTDRARNLLILSGDRAQIDALRETIAVFDVDWMRGMSTAIIPVTSSTPSAIAANLTEIFGGEAAGPGAVIRFLPNESLNAILIITPRAAYLDRARTLIANLDRLAAEEERQIFVYHIQNRPVRELAAVLQGVVSSDGGMNAGSMNVGSMNVGSLSNGSGGYGLQAGSSPGALGSNIGSGLGGSGGGSSGGGGSFGGASNDLSGNGPGGFGGGSGGYGSSGGSASGGFAGGSGTGGSDMSGLGGTSYGGATNLGFGSGSSFGDTGVGRAGGGQRGNGRSDGVSIVPDDANNSLVISATPNQYNKILKILTRLDAMPTQVLLETVIAEVTLNDNLAFGVQYFMQHGTSGLNLATQNSVSNAGNYTGQSTVGGVPGLAAAAVAGANPGFSYLLSNSNFNVVLNALSGVTRVNVLSSPNITVLDSHTARLQVGDQVPIVQTSAQSTLTTGAPILNQIQLKDTGVILSVTPRVNKNGLVILDINQEVSDVVATTSSTINSPTIQQRRIATSVAVKDGHSLALGGLVQEKAQIDNEGIPVLDKLPIIGAAFRNRSDSRTRTELIIFIRPRVMRNTTEADQVSAEFRQQLREMMPTRPAPRPEPLPPVQNGIGGLRDRILD